MASVIRKKWIEDEQHEMNCFDFEVTRPVVELKISPGKGRGLFATQDLKEGEFVFQEVPIVSLPVGGTVKADTYCTHCYVILQTDHLASYQKERGGAKPIEYPINRCTTCGAAYCSKSCMQNGLDGHRWICNRLEGKKCAGWALDAVPYFGIVAKWYSILRSCQTDAQWRLWSLLKSHPAYHYKGERWMEAEPVYQCMYENFLKNAPADIRKTFSREWVGKTYGKIVLNAMTGGIPAPFFIPPDNNTNLSRSTFVLVNLLSSMINHNCTANVSWSYSNGTCNVIIHTTKEVQKGEELFVSYMGTNIQFEEKKKFLFVNKLFTCDCLVCVPQHETLLLGAPQPSEVGGKWVSKICNNCNEKGFTLRSCSTCRTAHYCSRECVRLILFVEQLIDCS
eukprot:TRINITY_DN4135_c0_g2_i1.p1 TRINITY_DN4135_c0_g2~~TRINITY_DN4135_c0_g2_i1.p1  ORF type:complete len:394 (-),score=69.02 TRINITY_DN4135_c0_g2_i1:263-1444(-)